MKNSSTDDPDNSAANFPIQPDLFVADNHVHDWPAKDDLGSMEYPLFSLSKKPDLRIREYSRGANTVKVIPSVQGAANVFDKDIIIYAISRLVQASNMGAKVSRRIRIDTHTFLLATQRSTGGASYERIIAACRRLKGTVIETNVRTTDSEKTKGFSMIDEYEITRSTKNAKGALEVEVTISDWLYRQVLAYDVLTLSPEYFRLGQAIERRLYELARKHAGDKAIWKINIPLLQDKCGSRQARKFFLNDLRKIVREDALPDYRLLIDDSTSVLQAVFLTRDSKKLLFELNRGNLMQWFNELQKSNAAKPKKVASPE